MITQVELLEIEQAMNSWQEEQVAEEIKEELKPKLGQKKQREKNGKLLGDKSRRPKRKMGNAVIESRHNKPQPANRRY